ncbi:MAG: bacillithiol system redox-active protein YtxJ [Phaeodactylibacter sp.]|nr:bacillithiol system redox-active protein YtxJ [Phaeodactylibacter sp.]MCB9050595.1 bacillithiol system redox-active protein YtxJ [Lewinellaceae bacterium]
MSTIHWLPLTATSQIKEIVEHSRSTTCIIYKHSTRCSLSSLARNRLEKDWQFDERAVLPYFLDLIAYREVSNLVEDHFGVVHQSPQILLIQDARCVYHASHLDINARSLQPFFRNTEQA